ncbi:MAG TPA: ABC transporter ATP-binding protein [bacterium]|nr:ABC transporter ATP-binding protein [bacterium]HOL47157.1 ABC transporter ATP-binding protein [bacterium]HPQ18080.1 ABC transporter ATP-binding protein [bacterium]
MLVKLENVTKIYVMGKGIEVSALKNINLNIERNEYIAIMGASGSGKSTLMNIIGCLDTVTSGKYYLDGNEVEKLDDNELAVIRNKKIGFVFQTFNLLSFMTALENVQLPLLYGKEKNSKEKAKIALEKVGLKDRMNHKPTELSGGQRQRVAIARAIVSEPSIILADEPTGNLDSKVSEEIMNIFSELRKQGTTIILVTHEKDIAEYADRIIILKDGQIINDYNK